MGSTNSEAGAEIKSIHQDGDYVRRIHGRFIDEDEKFLTVDLNKYTVRISVRHIFKIEVVKPRRGYNSQGKSEI